MMSKLKLPSMGSTGALVFLAVFGALFISMNAKAESLAYPGPGVYRPNPYAVAGGFRVAGVAGRPPMAGPVGAPRPPMGGPRPPMAGGFPPGGSHGVNTFPPIVAGVRGAVMVRGGGMGGRPCGGCQSRCHRPCGGQRRCGGGGCGGMRGFSISISFRGGCGGGMRRGGCRRRC